MMRLIRILSYFKWSYSNKIPQLWKFHNSFRISGCCYGYCDQFCDWWIWLKGLSMTGCFHCPITGVRLQPTVRLELYNYCTNHIRGNCNSWLHLCIEWIWLGGLSMIASRSSDFINHSYDYRPNWTPLGPITIINHNHSNFRKKK